MRHLTLEHDNAGENPFLSSILILYILKSVFP